MDGEGRYCPLGSSSPARCASETLLEHSKSRRLLTRVSVCSNQEPNDGRVTLARALRTHRWSSLAGPPPEAGATALTSSSGATLRHLIA
jgi:hypothetical protein